MSEAKIRTASLYRLSRRRDGPPELKIPDALMAFKETDISTPVAATILGGGPPGRHTAESHKVPMRKKAGRRKNRVRIAERWCVLAFAKDLFNLLVEGWDPPIQVPEEVVKFRARILANRCQLVVLTGYRRRVNP